jgi:hypothetical protein
MAALDLAVCLPLTSGPGIAAETEQLALPLGSWARVDLAPEQPSSILADVPLLATLIGETTIAKHWPTIREYAQQQGLMFATLEGEPLRMHDLRHAFASYCVAELKLNKTVVGQLLGHEDGRSTDRYTHWSAEHLRAPAAEIAAGIGGTSMDAGQEERLGLDTDRLARVIRELGESDVGAKADRQVAAKLGVSEFTVRSWRTGEREPPYTTLHRLAQLRGVKPGWFFFGVTDALPKLRGQRAVS